MQKTKIFFPLTKVDAVQRLVYGRITSETVDKANEIFDYETSKPYFEKWSQDIHKATGGKSLGNVRVMHGPIAAGKLVDLAFDDAAKTIDCCAKIVDDNEWKKVEEGVYTGFSMGGAYVKRWTDPNDSTVKRFTANPAEVSIVDNPCVKDAHFTAVKADGVTEEVAFKIWAPDNDAVAAKAAELATAAGEPESWPDRLDEARDTLIAEKSAEAIGDPEVSDPPIEAPAAPEAPAEGDQPAEPAEGAEPEAPAEPEAEKAAPMELVQRWVTPDGQLFEKKADANTHLQALKVLASSESPLARAIAAAKAMAAPAPAVAEETFVFDAEAREALASKAEALGKALTQIEPAAGTKLEKGMWMVSEFAEALARLVSTCRSAAWEAESEKDGSTVPSVIAQGIATLGAALVDMAREEVAEALAELQEMAGGVVVIEPIYVELAAAVEMVKADTALMEKVGARNSKKDAAKIQATHDHMIELGAKCAASKADEGDDLAKRAAEADDLRKQMAEALPEIENLGKMLGETNEALKKANEQIEALKKAPAPMPQIAPGTGVVSKGADGMLETGDSVLTTATAADAVAKAVEALGIDKVRDLLLEKALSQPIRLNT